MISLGDARTTIAQHISALPPQPCALSKAFGRVLRADVLAREEIPAFDRSAMDGYALRGDEQSDRVKIVGECTPGKIAELSLEPGECVRIFTGAAIPREAGRVVPQEMVEREGDFIMIKKAVSQPFIRWRGEDAKQGDTLLKAGTRLSPGEISLLAQVGEVSPLTSPKVRVVHIATGDELVPPDQKPEPGQIRDSNSALVRALLAQVGAELHAQERCGDDRVMLRQTVEGALQAGCNLLLLSGGASVGDYDFGPCVLEELGFTIHFRQIDLKPGKPLVFATRGETAAFVIPGNPVSHFVTFHVAIRAALERLEGEELRWPIVAVRLLAPIPEQRDPRETYWPTHLTCVDGRLCAQPLKWQSSGDLRGLVGAGGLLQIRPGSTPVESGGEMPCLLLSRI